MAFPWLYPGGNGDFVESRDIKVDCKEWAHHQLYLADGRFATDKIWCFYAMNYVERRRNQTQGRWFVEFFLHNETIPSLDDLKQKIEGGTTKFIQKMQYFSSTVPGSDAYWRGKNLNY